MQIYDYFEKIEKPCSQIFYEMSARGITVDLKYLKDLKEYLEEQRQPIEKDIKNELGDINLNSPKQLLEALHEKKIYPEFKGKQSTDKRALESLRNAGYNVINNLLHYSELDTLLSSFVYPYLERNQEVVHPYFNQCGTRTGRLSCSNPNLLQIPKRSANGKLVRKMFIAREGHYLGDCDFGQIEPRIMAHLSKDPSMLGMFNDGTDFHEFTSTRLNINRERAKVLNLSVGYRGTFKSVSTQLKCSAHEAQVEIDKWWSMFPKLKAWQDQLIWQVKKQGYLTTLLGRRIKVDNLNEDNKWKREAAERQLINNLCQASAAEVMKLGMLNVYKAGIPMLIQVYDELVTEHEYKNEIVKIKRCMETAATLDCPLAVEAKVGKSWGEME